MKINCNTVSIIVFLLSAILFQHLFLFYRVGLSMFIFVSVTVAIFETLKYLHFKKFSLNIYYLLLIPIFFSSFIFTYRANEFVLFLNFSIIVFLTPLYFFLTVNPEFLNKFKESEIVSLLLNLVTQAANLFRVNIKTSKSIEVIKGIFLAGIVLLVVLPLLMSADHVFSNFVTDNFVPNFSVETLVKLILSIGFSLVLWSYAVGYIRSKKLINLDIPVLDKYRTSPITIPIALALLSLVYLLFIIFQLNYLLGSDEWVKLYNLTYAEYAIQGFWEMIFVSIINFGILYVLQTKISYEKGSSKLIIPLSLFILVVNFIMILSSHTRLSLYEDAYGYTIDRLIPHTFLIFTLVCTLLFAVNTFVSEELRKKVINIGLFTTIIIYLMGFSLFQMDRFIVNKNLERLYADESMNHNSLDLSYLIYQLGLEGSLELAKHKDNAKLQEYMANYWDAEIYDHTGEGNTAKKLILEDQINYEFDRAQQAVDKGGYRSWNLTYLEIMEIKD